MLYPYLTANTEGIERPGLLTVFYDLDLLRDFGSHLELRRKIVCGLSQPGRSELACSTKWSDGSFTSLLFNYVKLTESQSAPDDASYLDPCPLSLTRNSGWRQIQVSSLKTCQRPFSTTCLFQQRLKLCTRCSALGDWHGGRGHVPQHQAGGP